MNPDNLDDLWRQRLADLSQSGLSVRQWCEHNGVSKSTYGYWRRKLAEANSTQSEGRGWITVAHDRSAPTASRGLTVRIAGAAIDVETGFDPSLLRAVVLALGNERC